MKEVFISYSSVDAPQAETVRNVLEKNGLSCWMAPRDIPGGSNYTKEIPIAIRNCRVFVLILSKNAQGSHWVLKELDSAVNNGKVILPFMLEDCILNDEFNFLLTGAQRYSAYQKTAETMQLLVSRIRGILGADGTAAAEEEKKPAKEQEQITEQDYLHQKSMQQPKSEPASTGDQVCVCCGSAELTPLPKRLLRKGLKEWATLLLIPAMAAAGLLLGMFLATITWLFELLLPFMLVGMMGGAIWGAFLSQKIVRRSRLRNRLDVRCFRCKKCDKVFRVENPLL